MRFDNGLSLDFMNMGLFVGGIGWIHPEISISTYELIFVTEGEVFIEENGKYYHLTQGDLLCLRPGVLHRGYKETDGSSFFWLHFYSDNYEKLGVWLHHLTDIYNTSLLFKQLGHLSQDPDNRYLIECKLAAFLFDVVRGSTSQSKLFSDICEYVRINISAAPSVKDVSKKYSYSTDYLSRVFKENCGTSLKAYIDAQRNSYVKHLLLNTNMTIKEIGYSASFDSDNSLIKFFKYHNGISPTTFRNSYYLSHTNNK